MRHTVRKGIVLLGILVLAASLLAACGGDDGTPSPSPTPSPTQTPTPSPTPTETPTLSPTASPTPEPGAPTWEYHVNYGDENTVWTVAVIGEETLEGAEYYITEATFDVPVYRAFFTSPDTLIKFRYMKDWLNEATVDIKATEIDMNALEMIDLITTVTYIYGSDDHGWPLSVGNNWPVYTVGTLEPEMSPSRKTDWEAEVVAIEEVTVPMGTYECYKVVYTMVAVNDEPLDNPTVKTEWWSTGNEFLAPIKVVDSALYTDTESREMVSYTDAP